MTYKFVTREELTRTMNENFTPNCFLALIDILLAEREAYREVALKLFPDAVISISKNSILIPAWDYTTKTVDDEAARLLEGKK